MAVHRKTFGDERNPVYQVLYYLVIAALLAVLVMMYLNWRNSRKQYDALVKEAAATDVEYDIEARKLRNTDETDSNE